MKHLHVFLLALVGLIFFQPSASRAAVDFGFFYDELSPYGDWVEVDDYGYCFQPFGTDDNWRPYADGYWADSDEGWVWVSNEPHGWATYHYGRWANVTGRGWVWVPGYEWGPGWVSWRESNDYVGWAPLPPQARWRPQTGIRFGVSFGFGDVGPGYYNFIEPRYFGYPRMRDYVLPYDRNVNIIEQTTNITNITSVVNNNQTIIYNNGPNRDYIRGRSERPVRRLSIDRDPGDLTAAQLRNRKLRNEVNGDRYRVVSPKVQRAEGVKPKKVAGRVNRGEINDGYSRIADKKKADEVRKRIQAQAKDPKNQEKNTVAAKPGGGDRQNANNNRNGGKPGNDARRDEVLKRQAELEKRPKNADARQREERERSQQDRIKREQLKKQAGSAGEKKPGDSKASSKQKQQPAKPQQQKPQQQAKPQNKPQQQKPQQQAKPQNKPQQQKPQQQARPQNKPQQQKPQQQAKPQNRPQQQKPQQQVKPQNKPQQQKSQQQAKSQNKPQQQKNKPAENQDKKKDEKKKKSA